MAKTLLDYLKDHERQALEETQHLRVKSRKDAAYYGAVIKQITDRARARMKKETVT